MTTFSKRQNKKTLGIENLQGVTVMNFRSGKKFNVRFRAEVVVNGQTFTKSSFATPTEAAEAANNLYKNLLGGIRAAKKAGKWNVL